MNEERYVAISGTVLPGLSDPLNWDQDLFR